MTATPALRISTSDWPRSSPRFATPRDPTRDTRGPITLAHLTRLRRAVPYPWQWQVADVAGELDESGTGFRYPIVVLSVPRRAGKTTLTLAANLDHLDVTDDAMCWYTAHRREAAAKMFRDEWSPMLARLPHLYRLRRSQGSEGVHKRRGWSSLQIFAPTDDALHSTNADTVTVDEAWAFSVDQGVDLEAGARAAQLTRPWRQTWIVSAGGTIASTWWDEWLIAGEQQTPGVALFDFGADPTAPDYDPGDPAVWVRAHPTAGYGFPLEKMRHEWDTRRSDADFERPFLNVWPRPSQVTVAAGLELEAWRHAAHPDAALERPAALALDVAADRSSASLAAAGYVAGHNQSGAVASGGPPGASPLVVEVIDDRPGVAWVAAAVRAARRRWPGVPVVADSLVAASIVAELNRARVTVDTVGVSDHARACGTFVDELAAGRLWHRAQAVLDDAVAGAARRPLGDAWLWSRSRSSVNISPLVAVTLAAWAAGAARPTGRAVVVVGPTEQTSPRRNRPRSPVRAATAPRRTVLP